MAEGIHVFLKVLPYCNIADDRRIVPPIGRADARFTVELIQRWALYLCSGTPALLALREPSASGGGSGGEGGRGL
jgi:hypothetical protein